MMMKNIKNACECHRTNTNQKKLSCSETELHGFGTVELELGDKQTREHSR